MKWILWGIAIAGLVSTCAILGEYGWTGFAWLVGAWYLGKFLDNQQRIRDELEEINARDRDRYGR